MARSGLKAPAADKSFGEMGESGDIECSSESGDAMEENWEGRTWFDGRRNGCRKEFEKTDSTAFDATERGNRERKNKKKE